MILKKAAFDSANEKTAEAFAQVVQQTHTTNESVQKIREATELITSIASQLKDMAGSLEGDLRFFHI